MQRFALPCFCGLLGWRSLSSVHAAERRRRRFRAATAARAARARELRGERRLERGASSGGSGGNGSSSGDQTSSGSSSGSAGSSGLPPTMRAVVTGDEGGRDSSSSGGDGSASPGLFCKAGNQSNYLPAQRGCCISTGFTGTTATCQSSNNCTGTIASLRRDGRLRLGRGLLRHRNDHGIHHHLQQRRPAPRPARPGPAFTARAPVLRSRGQRLPERQDVHARSRPSPATLRAADGHGSTSARSARGRGRRATSTMTRSTSSKLSAGASPIARASGSCAAAAAR